MRTFLLTTTLVRRSPFRIAMLLFLTAIAVVVFLIVAELSRVSVEGLDSAIDRDNGIRGSYSVAVDATVRATLAEQNRVVAQVARDLNMDVVDFTELYPALKSECPPFEVVGEQQLRIAWIGLGEPEPLPFGSTGGIDTQWCILGQRIPATSLYVADTASAPWLAEGLYISAKYRDLLAGATVEPIRTTFTLVSQSTSDQSGPLRVALVAAMEASASRWGVDSKSTVSVVPAEHNADNVRAAADGISSVYSAIGWGVIALAGIAIVTVQSLSARQRRWFYGLQRSLGASTRLLALGFAIEALIVAVGALALAATVLFFASDSVAGFSNDAFGVDADPLQWDAMAHVIGGLVAIALGATAIPLVSASRHDPLEVLEAPRD